MNFSRCFGQVLVRVKEGLKKERVLKYIHQKGDKLYRHYHSWPGRQGFWTSFYLISKGHRYLFCILFTSCLLSQLSSQILKLVNQPMVVLAFGRSMVFWCLTSRHWNEAMMEISFIVGMKSWNLNLRFITITEDDNLNDSAISHYCCRFLWWHLDVQFLTVFHITPTSSNFENSLIYSAIFGNFYC